MNHLRVAGVRNSISSPALSEMGRMASPALPKSLHNFAISPTSPAFRGVTLSPALQRKSCQSTGDVQLQRVISPSNSLASNASTSPDLSVSLSQTHSNSSRPSTPSSLMVKSKVISPGPGRPIIESADFSSKSHHRGFKRTRDNDEETMTGFEVISLLFIVIKDIIVTLVG